jgi:hypothetical protein
MFGKSAKLIGLLCLALILVPGSSGAQEKPIQLSFIGPTMQLVDDDADIKGLRLNLIYGINRNVTGLDYGLVNRVRGDLKGFQGSLVGLAEGSFTGWQHNVINVAGGDMLYL